MSGERDRFGCAQPIMFLTRGAKGCCGEIHDEECGLSASTLFRWFWDQLKGAGSRNVSVRVFSLVSGSVAPPGTVAVAPTYSLRSLVSRALALTLACFCSQVVQDTVASGRRQGRKCRCARVLLVPFRRVNDLIHFA